MRLFSYSHLNFGFIEFAGTSCTSLVECVYACKQRKHGGLDGLLYIGEGDRTYVRAMLSQKERGERKNERKKVSYI